LRGDFERVARGVVAVVRRRVVFFGASPVFVSALAGEDSSFFGGISDLDRSGKDEGQEPRGRSPSASTDRIKRDDEPADLFLKELDRAVVPKNEVGPYYFLRQWQLLGNSLLGERAR
jgi:hypothetical protein